MPPNEPKTDNEKFKQALIDENFEEQLQLVSKQEPEKKFLS